MANTSGSHVSVLLGVDGVNVAGSDVRRVCVMTLWMEEAANYQLRAMTASNPRYFTAEEPEHIYPKFPVKSFEPSLGVFQQPVIPTDPVFADQCCNSKPSRLATLHCIQKSVASHRRRESRSTLQ